MDLEDILMNPIIATVVLKSDQRFGSKTPPHPLGEILRAIPLAVRQSIRMAFEGRSTARGKYPHWLTAASDIRLVDLSGEDNTILRFEAPTFGEAAPELYEQKELFDLGKPAPEDTGFDALGDVLGDLSENNPDSDRFDRALLRRLMTFQRGFNGTFQEAVFTGKRYRTGHPAVLNKHVIQIAEAFSSETPKPERVRVVGTLDMIRASTQAFALKVDDGQELRGIMVAGEIGDHKQLLERRVLVLGKAVYRPSGRLLRVDTEEILAASANDTFFSRVPTPSRRKLDVRKIVREQSHKSGLAAIIGKWPGDETDEEIEAALQEMS
jgi:hypothetical protein